MISLTIDGKYIEIERGESILEAAKKLGLDIPTMCHLKGYTNHPSCMVCMVKDVNTGKLLPSCGVQAEDGMQITSDDPEVFEARKSALELLLSDHVGECEARCRLACPAFMDIPEMNRLIAADKPLEALRLVKEEIALPLVLGYVCDAPCENACRRNSVDGEAVSICQLKKFVALQDAAENQPYLPEKAMEKDREIAIIGAGPAGLSAAYHLALAGYRCTVFDRNTQAGGSLLNRKEGKNLPPEILEKEIGILRDIGVSFSLGQNVDQVLFEAISKESDAVLLATGTFIDQKSSTFNLSLNALKNGFKTRDALFQTEEKNIFACGSAVKPVKMAVRAVAEGKAAAYFIDTYFSFGEGAKQRRLFNSKFPRLRDQEVAEYLKESTPATQVIPDNELDGYTREKAIQEAQRCLRCDCRKPESCKLRMYADQYGAEQGIYPSSDRALVRKKYDHPDIVYEPEKCIRCSLCVDITQKDNEVFGLTHVGRGFDVRIDVPFSRSLQESLNKTALKCAYYCPTGALARK
jgi:NADPH-dependent glutamate synthase beta subunit-like oxidoreductase